MTGSPIPDPEPSERDDGPAACVMVFNANDPSGAAGITADLMGHQKVALKYLRKHKRAIIADDMGLGKTVQTIALLSTLTEREKDQNVVTLSTLHASKGLEWPHVMLVGVTEGMLPFKLDDEPGTEHTNDNIAVRLQEERRLMYVGITRAQRSLSVSWTRKRKKGRDMIAAIPSRFIAEMGLDKDTVKEDPREKLKALRAEFAQRASAASAESAANK